MNSLLKLVMLVSALWVIYDVWQVNEKLSQGAKIFWTILAAIFSLGTAILYYFMFKTQK